jgi:hypothetical protein
MPDSFVVVGPTSEAELRVAEISIRHELPSDLRDFLLRSGGGEGWIGGGYVAIYSTQELAEVHEGYQVDEFCPDLVLIGTDRGGEAFAIDRSTGRYVMTPFIGDEPAVRVDVGGSFEEFLSFVSRIGAPGRSDD